ncbi:phosphogluconate dehydratase [Nocardioides sp. SR21]|uniref:phosphogluconate dehydratase n=1 Tax=Nocardioides sp. SR21 TaxID=2919501 RepID=UPI001FAA2463|nr:phosphogluconate dehydratase [Nocardioides sp. SR21]
MTLHPVLQDVTARIVERSAEGRAEYLRRIRAAAQTGPARGRLACANLAHGFAASEPTEKQALRGHVKPNLAIVSSYNDMLSAHQPYRDYPETLKKAVIRAGGIAQFAGGVPAMCDGITQGRDGMQLSLYSRDVIAMSTAIALSHDMFDGALMLGVCDKITPGLLIGALSFGHLPTVFVPAGPMTSGLPNSEKAKVRQLYAEGKVGREELLEAEAASYHSAGTCTFYGTANSNQLLMEVLGLHLPGSSFVNPGTPLREALTKAAGRRVTELTRQGGEPTPIGEIVDERAIVNAVVALLASGGSTNHTMHLVAIARAAGITLTWDDMSDLSAVVPLVSRMYPNGEADVNHFHAAGGIAFLVHTLLRAGLLHDDVLTVAGRGLWRYTQEPVLRGDDLTWEEGPKASLDHDVLRPASDPFSADGGLRMLSGPLGRAVIKTSAVKPQHRLVTAPAVVFDDQHDFLEAFGHGHLDGRDFVAVIRYQGPAANGMPELHKLTPALGVLQDRGQKVAIVTDGRMSGASGKVPAAIHVTPEASLGGPLSRVLDGDLITLDADSGRLELHVDPADLQQRPITGRAPQGPEWAGTGRELFAAFRATVGSADTGASVFPGVTAPGQEVRVAQLA